MAANTQFINISMFSSGLFFTPIVQQAAKLTKTETITAVIDSNTAIVNVKFKV